MPALGVPESVPLAASVTPAGSGPPVVKVDAGKPLASTLKVPATPTWKPVALALVIAGACTDECYGKALKKEIRNLGLERSVLYAAGAAFGAIEPDLVTPAIGATNTRLAST